MQDLTRRRLLSGAAASVVAGLGVACTGSREEAPTPVVDPDHRAVAAALARERALLTAYSDAVTSFPHLTTELGALGGQHQQHLEALLEHAGTTPSPGSSAAKPSSPQHPDRSTSAEALRRRLADLERATGQQHGEAAVSASRIVAPLLSSLAACEASHALVLSQP